MILSMTGFGRGTAVRNGREITVELRSVNSRYFEYSSRIPRTCSYLDSRLKKQLNERISRGKVELSMTVQNVDAADTVVAVNMELARSYQQAMRDISEQLGVKNDISAGVLTRFPDVLTTRHADVDEEQLWEDVSAVTAQALDRFVEMRAAEGAKMKADVENRLNFLEECVGRVETLSAGRVEAYTNRLYEKLKVILEDRDIDDARVLTEAAIFGDKTAVDEETVRLRSHLGQLRHMLAQGGATGRKLDFLIQEFNREANTGLNYNPQVDLQPIFGAEGGSLKDTLAAEAGGKAEDILATDLVLCITEKAQRVGLQGEYFMSGRIDDLECAYATLYGFLQGRGEEAGRGDIWVMFDNEEVGSSSRQGAQGSLMSDVLARIEESLGVTKEQSIRARTNCLLLSADNGHAIHPNHPEKSDQKLPVNMGGGVILKYNARQTYTTSGLTGAAFTAICEKAGVPVQTFANRADVAGGSTLGNLLGRQILMPMVDIGVGQLAMHSAMETASCKDAEYLANACAAYYNTPIFQPEDGQWKLGL